MIPNTNQVMQEDSSNEVSHIKQAPRVDCYETSKNGLKGCVFFKYLSNLLICAASFDRFRQPAVAQRRISMTWLMGRNGVLSAFGATIIALFCFAGASPLAAAPTLHEQLLAADPGLREADEAHSAAYRLLRSILDKGSQQQLKNEQLGWINSLNLTLAQTPAWWRKPRFALAYWRAPRPNCWLWRKISAPLALGDRQNWRTWQNPFHMGTLTIP